MAQTLVATRPSGQDPNTQEFYNTQTNTGFSNPSQVFDFAKSQGLVGSRPSAVNPQVSELFNPTSGQGFTNEAEALSFIASQPVPQATNVNIADKVKTPIPAENLTANAVTAGDINKLLADNMKYRDQVMGLFNPTPDEVQAQQDLNAVRQKARETKLNAQAGILQEGNRLAPMTAIQGGQRNIQEQANLQLQTLGVQEQPLVDQLNILSSNRQSKLQALQFMISQGQYDIGLAREIAKDKKEEEKAARQFSLEYGVNKPFYTIDGKTIYNTQTGKGYSDWSSFIADGGDPKLGNVEQISKSIDQQLEQAKFQRSQFESDRQYQLDLAKLTMGGDRKTQVVDLNGQKVLIDSDTGETIKTIGSDTSDNSKELQIAESQSQIGNIDYLLNKDNGLNSAVGPNAFSRATNFFTGLFSADTKTGAKSRFIGGVEQIVDQLNLDKLIQSKAKGATFGALSDNELRVLASAATKIGTWRIKDKNGNTIGYNIDERTFKKELDSINNFAKLDYILKGGDPTAIGVNKEADGAYTTKNSDGSITELLPAGSSRKIENQNTSIYGPSSPDFNSVGNTRASGMRTDRHNNPVAFTTDIAKQAGLKLGTDYQIGDAFPNNPNLRTAKLLGDPVEETIKVIDRIGFYTQSGQPRWSYVKDIPQARNWKNLSYNQKKQVIAQMYSHEGGSALRQYFT